MGALAEATVDSMKYSSEDAAKESEFEEKVRRDIQIYARILSNAELLCCTRVIPVQLIEEQRLRAEQKLIQQQLAADAIANRMNSISSAGSGVVGITDQGRYQLLYLLAYFAAIY